MLTVVDEPNPSYSPPEPNVWGIPSRMQGVIDLLNHFEGIAGYNGKCLLRRGTPSEAFRESREYPSCMI
jgi:hypothetical protein